MEKEFKVEWRIETYGETPREAAENALKIMRNPKSMATVFAVFDQDGNRHDVDLLEDEETEEKI